MFRMRFPGVRPHLGGSRPDCSAHAPVVVFRWPAAGLLLEDAVAVVEESASIRAIVPSYRNGVGRFQGIVNAYVNPECKINGP
jgi:hypothetical protein